MISDVPADLFPSPLLQSPSSPKCDHKSACAASGLKGASSAPFQVLVNLFLREFPPLQVNSLKSLYNFPHEYRYVKIAPRLMDPKAYSAYDDPVSYDLRTARVFFSLFVLT